MGSPKLVRGWALGWEWLGLWTSVSRAPKGLRFWYGELVEAGIPGARQSLLLTEEGAGILLC